MFCYIRGSIGFNLYRFRLFPHPSTGCWVVQVRCPVKRGCAVLFIHTNICTYTHTHMCVWVGADKSLARRTSRCPRTESIVSERVCSCAELQVFSCYRGRKEACQATRAISTNWRHKLSSSPPTRQGVEGNSRHSDRNIRGTWNIICHHQKLGSPV